MVDSVGELVVATVQSMEQQLRDVDHCEYILVIPPSIEYRGPLLNAGIIMIDDLQTRRETSRACRDILKARTSCSKVVGIYLGRTHEAPS